MRRATRTAVPELLGQATIVMTMRYAHIAPDDGGLVKLGDDALDQLGGGLHEVAHRRSP